MNCCLRFGFGGATVLMVSSGHSVSFNTTDGGERQFLPKGETT
jgi:hypothetical protein